MGRSRLKATWEGRQVMSEQPTQVSLDEIVVGPPRQEPCLRSTLNKWILSLGFLYLASFLAMVYLALSLAVFYFGKVQGSI